MKQYEKDLNAEQRQQFDAYKKELVSQIREKRDVLQRERESALQDKVNYPGLKIGEYNPDFRDLLKRELERQILDKKSKSEEEKARKLAEDKDRVRRLNEATKKKDQEAQNYQMSMRRKLKDMVKSEYDKTVGLKDNKQHLKLVDKDIVPELDVAAAGLGIGHTEDVTLDTPTRIKRFHELHAVNRKTPAEDDYWFVKRLMENEQQIIHTEEKNKRNLKAAMETMMHSEVTQHPKKVIVGSKLRNKH